jgi:hypothetical protein
MFYSFEFCLKKMWNCSLTKQILSHSFYDWKLYELFLLGKTQFYILQSWKLKRSQIQFRPHHIWIYTSNLTTVVNSVLKCIIHGTTSILKS